MSLFKRKGRRIATFEDEAPGDASLGEQDSTSEPPIQAAVKFGKRPTKQSALRRSATVDNGSGRNDDDNEDKIDGPAVVRPSLSRSGSARSKKRMSTSSRLSFGIGATSEADEATAEDGASVTATPRRTGIASLSQRVLETNAFRKSLTGRLPTRPLDREDEDRPRYSKEYLEELQSSTPNTPRNVSSKKREGDVGSGDSDYSDAMQLDASELEGATVAELSDLGTLRTGMIASPAPAAHVLTQTEIDERKDRRARLALEQNAIALGSDDDEENGYISLVSGDSKKRKKKESRLVREDEDLGEGFDEFVEDGGLSLGRKAEREARRRRKQEMASLISAAEGKSRGGGGSGHNGKGNNNDDDEDNDNDDDDMDSDDSEAERQAAYNEAQTRAGMDGLKRRGAGGGGADDDDDDEMNILGGSSRKPAGGAIPKMQPLPDLAECLARLQRTVQKLEDEVAQRRKKLAEIEAEKAEIAAREAELQEILNKTGEKYQAILGVKVAANTAKPASPAAAAAAAASLLAATQSPLRPFAGVSADGPAERGLESLGGTPVRRADDSDNVL